MNTTTTAPTLAPVSVPVASPSTNKKRRPSFLRLTPDAFFHSIPIVEHTISPPSTPELVVIRHLPTPDAPRKRRRAEQPLSPVALSDSPFDVPVRRTLFFNDKDQIPQ